MTSTWARAVCRLLVALVLFHSSGSQATLIGTGAALERTPERAALFALIDRADVARGLLAAGVDPLTAKDRVAALSDDEARSLAGHIDATPAGADAAGILLLVVVVALVWWAWKR
jgi:hypothetical protein